MLVSLFMNSFFKVVVYPFICMSKKEQKDPSNINDDLSLALMLSGKITSPAVPYTGDGGGGGKGGSTTHPPPPLAGIKLKKMFPL